MTELITGEADLAGFPSTDGYDVERVDIATRGHAILAAQGIRAEDATHDQLAAAYEQAEAELASQTSSRMTGGQALDWALNATAESILAEQGKSVESCTEAEFVAAVKQAEVKLGRAHRSIR